MTDADISLTPLRGLTDPYLIPWLALYETAFPPGERLLVATLLEMAQAQTPASDDLLLSAVSAGEFVGLVHVERFPGERVAALWYLAVAPQARNSGLGARIYQALWRRLQAEGYRALVFEVEMPELAQDEAARALAERRINFYRRQGARLLTGIEHIQQVGPHQPPIPMHVMVHCAGDCLPDEALRFAELSIGSVRAVGELGLA